MNNRGYRGRGSQLRGRVEVARGRGQLHPANPSMMRKFEPESSKSAAGSSIRAPLRRSFADVLEPAKLAPGDWSPLDDDIPIVLPNSSDKAPTRDEVHAHILSTIKDPYTKKRLPVFEKICQESEEQDFLERHTWEPPNPGQFSKKSLRRRGSNWL
ncbi:unnamed protein product [Lupinus luteus]|uniref:Uncharacterized protein n=1 Tax=Lupinus luteus TaxID=3873 RepID=A0AAV1XSM6_LUPLU